MNAGPFSPRSFQLGQACIKRATNGLLFLQLVLIGWAAAGVPAAYALHPITSKADILGVYPAYPTIDYRSTRDADAIKRGEYLAKIGDCVACHSNPSGNTPPFAGGLPIKTPFGTFYTPNITPDKTTGIGDWSEADFMRAMHEGILADGSNAFPAFPYVYFNRVSKADLKDLWAYLQAIPAVNLKNKGNTLPIVADWRMLQYGWKILYFYPDEGFFEKDPSRSQAWNRGAYLVNGLGHCTMCHTPMNLIGGEKKKYFLTGSLIEGYWAPDITRLGLETASRYQVAKVFIDSKLIDRAGPVRGPMAEVNHDSLHYLTEADQRAIVEYLKSVVSKQPRTVPRGVAGQPRLKRGEQVYANVCVMCHLNGNAGAPRIGNQADWEQRLSVGGLPALDRHAIDGFNKMPVKGACVTCDDDDITAAVRYILYHSLEHSQWEELLNPPRIARTEATSLAAGRQVYEEKCSVCHAEGKLGAPKIGDRQRWAPLIRRNLDVLILDTLKGKGNMPPKGGCTHCSGSQVIAAVKYMVQQSQSGGDYSLW
jgi:cytochrome c5